MKTRLLLTALAATLLLCSAHDDYGSTCSGPLYERINTKFRLHISSSDESTLPSDIYYAACPDFVRALGSVGKEFGITADVCIAKPNSSLIGDISARIFDKLDSRYFNITSIRNSVAYSFARNSTHIENYLSTIETTLNELKANDTAIHSVYTVLYPLQLVLSGLALVVNTLALICLVHTRHLNKSRKVLLVNLVIACLLTATFETCHLTLKLDRADLIVFFAWTICVFLTVFTILTLSVDINLSIFRPLRYLSNSYCRAATYIIAIWVSAFALGAVFIAAANHHHNVTRLLIICFIEVCIFLTALFQIVVLIKINVESEKQVRKTLPMNDARLTDQRSARTQRLTIVLLIVAALTLLLLSPYCVHEVFLMTGANLNQAILYRFCVKIRTSRMISGMVADFCLVLNCCVNPLCYVLGSPDIRKGFWLAIQRCCPSTTVETSDNWGSAVSRIVRRMSNQSLVSNRSTRQSRRRSSSRDARREAMKQPFVKPKNDKTARDSRVQLLRGSGDAVSISAPQLNTLQQQLPHSRLSFFSGDDVNLCFDSAGICLMNLDDHASSVCVDSDDPRCSKLAYILRNSNETLV